MNWQALLDPDIRKFITAKADSGEDISALALKKPPSPDWPYALVLDQIKARRKAALKMPEWGAFSDIIYPAATVIEQASSQPCALYKAHLLQDMEGLIGQGQEQRRFADLTAGSGMDTITLARIFSAGGVAIEREPQSAAILAHNLKAMGIDGVEVLNQSAEDWLEEVLRSAATNSASNSASNSESTHEAPPFDLVFCDPQRREGQKRGLFRLEDCTPDITALLPRLRKIARFLLLKTSPILDIHQMIETLEGVCAVHVLEYQGECKELLALVDLHSHNAQNNTATAPQSVNIHAVRLDEAGRAVQAMRFTHQSEVAQSIEFSEPLRFIFEPSPAFQKAGGIKTLAADYGLYKLHPNTHLYTSERVDERAAREFPGRIFEIEALSAVNQKALKAHLPDLRASLTVRNFPMKTEDLRKKLSLKDGGYITVFACEAVTLGKTLIICQKFAKN
ncbi:MAG: THUMP-like domain-containing protein [Alphaproteobacteria bacterium]